jgi:hypothetical protein
MARVYLMIEDLATDDAGITWSVDWGLAEGETLPESVDDMTDAQFAAWRFVAVLRDMEAKADQAKVATPESKLILPGSQKVM